MPYLSWNVDLSCIATVWSHKQRPGTSLQGGEGRVFQYQYVCQNRRGKCDCCTVPRTEPQFQGFLLHTASVVRQQVSQLSLSMVNQPPCCVYFTMNRSVCSSCPFCVCAVLQGLEVMFGILFGGALCKHEVRWLWNREKRQWLFFVWLLMHHLFKKQNNNYITQLYCFLERQWPVL